MKDTPINEQVHSEHFNKALAELRGLSENTAFSAVADSIAVNRQLASALIESRKLVEDEAVLVVDAMCLAFDDKSAKLKTLRAATAHVSAESAFMKTALNTIETKTREIQGLTQAVDELSASLERFRDLVDDGTLDRAASAALAIR